jgi:hypothetical protein
LLALFCLQWCYVAQLLLNIMGVDAGEIW